MSGITGDQKTTQIAHPKSQGRMGQGFLMDTNVIIDLLYKALPQNGMAVIATLPPVISEVTRMELLGWLNVTPAQLAPIQSFVIKATVLAINES